MAAKCITGALLIVLVASICEAQIGWNNQINNQWNQGSNTQNRRFPWMGNGNGLWGTMTSNQNNDRYVTCISKNSNFDELRMTFTQPEQSRNWWENRWGSQRSIRLEANIRVGQQSNINGMYRLLITENGRAADGCDINALGNVYNNFNNLNMWLTPNRQTNSEAGVLGNAFRLTPMNGQHWNGNLDQINDLNDIVGRACILCPENAMFNGRCNAPVDLCCTMGFDSQPASRPFNQRAGVSIQGVAGITNVGTMGNGNMGTMNTGMGNMGSGAMGTGMQTGVMGTGMQTGVMGTGMQTGGMTNGGLNTGGTGVMDNPFGR